MKHSHLRILLNLRELFTAGMAVRKFSLCFVCTDQVGFRATMYGSYENEEKIDNDNVLRNDHRSKTTRPISMILVSFFSEDNVLSDEIEMCYIFEHQSNENRAFCFFGTPGIVLVRSLIFTMN